MISKNVVKENYNKVIEEFIYQNNYKKVLLELTLIDSLENDSDGIVSLVISLLSNIFVFLGPLLFFSIIAEGPSIF
jgi:hypothetical protein